MATHWFSAPVAVRTERAGLTRNVNNVEAAGQELMKWTKRGPKWNQAVRVCIACIADEMEPEEARKAFLAAAKEEWPAAGFVDTEIRCLTELESGNAEKEVQPRVQA